LGRDRDRNTNTDTDIDMDNDWKMDRDLNSVKDHFNVKNTNKFRSNLAGYQSVDSLDTVLMKSL
jgi:hypothetical protein